MSLTASTLIHAINAQPALHVAGTLLEAADLPSNDLTTAPEAFFARRGYQLISRDQAARAIQATREFQDLCPQSSAVMVRAL